MSYVMPRSRTVDDQVQFARHNLDNHQALIRFADTKAAAFLTLLVFLGATALPIAKDAAPKLRLIACGGAFTSSLYLVSSALFLIGFGWTLTPVYLVMTPRGARHHQSARRGHELLFFDHVLLHPNHEDYFAAVSGAAPELLLRNLTDQVYELAAICHDKMGYLNKARLPVFLSFFGPGRSILCWGSGS